MPLTGDTSISLRFVSSFFTIRYLFCVQLLNRVSPDATRAEIEKFFTNIDVDGNGKIDESELKNLLKEAKAPADQIDALSERVSWMLSYFQEQMCSHCFFLLSRLQPKLEAMTARSANRNCSNGMKTNLAKLKESRVQVDCSRHADEFTTRR